MKQLIFLLLITSTAYGQTTSKIPFDTARKSGHTASIWATQKKDTLRIGIGKFPPTAILKQGSDTLEIMEPLQIHFIKIGNEVYQLVPHNTTIERVEPQVQITWPHGLLWGDRTIYPVFSGKPTDSIYIQSTPITGW